MILLNGETKPLTPLVLPIPSNERRREREREIEAMAALAMVVVAMAALMVAVEAGDHNSVFHPCADAKIQRWDGFTVGVAIAPRESFNSSGIQLSPCDSRLRLSSGNGALLAVFRPKVDEISLLTVNTSSLSSATATGFMVAFAGRKYAARSLPVFVGNGSVTVTSFTLVLEFKKGTLQNLYWKTDGCSSCSGKSSFVCVNNQYCAVKTTSCKGHNGEVDCSIGIQLAFSGTDKHDSVLNSWYEISNLRQYSLFGLYSNLKTSLTSQFNKMI